MNFPKVLMLLIFSTMIVVGVVFFLSTGRIVELQKKYHGESVDLGDIQITEIKTGEGVVAQIGDSIRVHYVGTLQNGMEFDNSRTRKKPLDFILGEGKVIQGEEGIVGMKVGGIRTIIVPSDQGYGSRSQGKVPPNSILIYEIELLKILNEE